MNTAGQTAALATNQTIYPDGQGRFALGSPDGRVLRQGEAITIQLGGHWIAGFVEYNRTDSFFTAEKDRSVCGLSAGMQVRLLGQATGPSLKEPSACRTGTTRIQWTAAMVECLRAAWQDVQTEPTTMAKIRAITQRTGWPIHTVQYKVYELGLPYHRPLASQGVLREHLETKEKDRSSSTANPAALSLVSPPQEATLTEKKPQERESHSLFAQHCPPVEEVAQALARLHCHGVAAVPAGRRIAAQYHYDGLYGVEVIFLAGYDVADEIERGQPLPPKHQARFWVSAPAHPQSQEVQQQVIAALQQLIDQGQPATQRRSA